MGVRPKLVDVKVKMKEIYAPKTINFSKWSCKFRKYPDVDITVLGRNGDNNPQWTIPSIEHRAYNVEEEDDEKQPEMDI